MKFLLSTNNGQFFWKFRELIVRELVRNGHEVHIICPNFNNTINIKNVHFHYVEMTERSYNPFDFISFWLRTIIIALQISPNVVVSYGVKNSLASMFVKGKKKVSFLTGFGNLYVSGRAKKIFFLIIMHITRLTFDQIWVLNRADYNFLAELFDDDTVLKLVPGEGFDASEYPMRDSSTKIEYDFVFIGRLLKDKGAIRFIRMGIHLSNLIPGIKLKIFGPLPKSFKKLLSFEEEKFFEEIYGGELAHSAPILQRAKFLVLPSRREGLSRITMEAMSTGCIVVGSAVPGVTDLIQHDYSGFLFDLSNNDFELALYLHSIGNLSDEHFSTLRKNARFFVEHRLNLDEVLSFYLALTSEE